MEVMKMGIAGAMQVRDGRKMCVVRYETKIRTHFPIVVNGPGMSGAGPGPGGAAAGSCAA